MKLLNQNSLLRGTLAIAMLATGLGLVRTADAQEKPATVTAEQVLDGHVKAVGGVEKLESFKNRRTTGKFSMPAAGLNGPMKIIQEAPNHYRMEMEIPGIGKVLQVCDGEKVLDKNPLTGQRMLSGAEKEAVMLEATFNSEAHWRDLYKNVSYEGREDVDGKPCHKIVLETKSGSKRTQYYDVATGLLSKVKAIVSSPQGELATESTVSDYKEVDGLKYAHKTVVAVLGQQQIIEIEQVEHDVQLPEGSFDVSGN